MREGYAKAKRLLDAVIVALDIEAHWSAGESAEWGQPYQSEIRELRDAADDYLAFRQKSM